MKLVRAKSIKPLHDFLVKVIFSNGETREIDLEPYLRGKIFEEIRLDHKLFQSMKIDSRMGAIVWENGADIDPDVIYHGLKPAWAEEPELELSK
jgi:Protein of unknown function (DUF2442)